MNAFSVCTINRDLNAEKYLPTVCAPSYCARCGFNSNIIEQRKALLEKNGLTKCRDGLMRLILPREEHYD